MHRADLLVIGAGPYAYAAAAFARYNGIDVRVVIRPMAFLRDFTRGGPTSWSRRGPSGGHLANERRCDAVAQCATRVGVSARSLVAGLRALGRRLEVRRRS